MIHISDIRSSRPSSRQIIAWSAAEIRRHSALPRAYTGAYPDCTGPSLADMDRVIHVMNLRSERGIT
jgi:hypothetical protein